MQLHELRYSIGYIWYTWHVQYKEVYFSHISGRGYGLGPACLSICLFLSACLSVCEHFYSWTAWPMALNFCMKVYLDPILEGESPRKYYMSRSKIKIAFLACYQKIRPEDKVTSVKGQNRRSCWSMPPISRSKLLGGVCSPYLRVGALTHGLFHSFS